MFHAEDGENRCQKRRVPGQANVRRRDIIHTAQAVNPMLQPVLGNVAVDEGVGRDSGKAENEKKTKRDTRERRDEKEPEMLAQQFAHGGKYSRKLLAASS